MRLLSVLVASHLEVVVNARTRRGARLYTIGRRDAVCESSILGLASSVERDAGWEVRGALVLLKAVLRVFRSSSISTHVEKPKIFTCQHYVCSSFDLTFLQCGQKPPRPSDL